MADLTTLRKDITDYIYFRLGGDMVDVELDPSHYTMCIDQALRKYRQRAGSSVESSYLFLSIIEEHQEYVNTYLLQAGRVGGQATYEMYYQYQEMSARMFGGFVNFEFNPVTRTVTLLRKFNDSGEKVVLWVYNTRPESGLLQDKQIQPWIQDYSLALAKFTLGEARSKFATIAGPQGGTSLNGDTLKAEAQAEMAQLEEDLKNYIDGSDPLSFIIG
mgnify:CR=1 FL=1